MYAVKSTIREANLGSRSTTMRDRVKQDNNGSVKYSEASEYTRNEDSGSEEVKKFGISNAQVENYGWKEGFDGTLKSTRKVNETKETYSSADGQGLDDSMVHSMPLTLLAHTASIYPIHHSSSSFCSAPSRDEHYASSSDSHLDKKVFIFKHATRNQTCELTLLRKFWHILIS
ncbi:hypothetical protein Plhal304r1_c064g0151711 [Plasmopara halstedii]